MDSNDKYHKQKPSISTFTDDNELFVKGLLLNSSESVKRSILESNDTTLINQWNELTAKKQQVQVLQEKEPQSDYLKQIQEDAEQLEKQITQSSAAYRENQAMWQITWDSVRNHLSPNEVSIEYFSAPLHSLAKSSKKSPISPLVLKKHLKNLRNSRKNTTFAPEKYHKFTIIRAEKCCKRTEIRTEKCYLIKNQ